METRNKQKEHLFTNSDGSATFRVTKTVQKGFKTAYDHETELELLDKLVERIIEGYSDPIGINGVTYDILTKTTLPFTTKLIYTYYTVKIELADTASLSDPNPFKNLRDEEQVLTERRHVCRFSDFPSPCSGRNCGDRIRKLNESGDLHINRYHVHVQFMHELKSGQPIAFTANLYNLEALINQYIFPDVNPRDRLFYVEVDMGGGEMAYGKVTMTYKAEEIYLDPATDPVMPSTSRDREQRVQDFRDLIDDLSRDGVFQNL